MRDQASQIEQQKKKLIGDLQAQKGILDKTKKENEDLYQKLTDEKNKLLSQQ
jgi:hypothetical protein